MADKEKMTTLEEYSREALHVLEQAHQRRRLVRSDRTGVTVTRDAQEYLSFSCNDYLGLSQHPAVIEAGVSALNAHGAGAGASRLVTGNHGFYTPLEQKIAEMKHTQSALVFGSGYLANMGIIPALVGPSDIIFADKLVHACLLDGAKLSGATLVRFAHNDTTHLQTLMAEKRGHYKHALILVDHVYSMDGDVAPLAEISCIARTHGAWLMADDAHGLGIVTPDPQAQVDVWMGTLSKAAGGYGGYVAASQSVIDLLTTKARSFVFSTGLPPACAASALAALEVMEQEPERATRALGLANDFCGAMGLPPTRSTIVPILLGAEARALAVSESLKNHGILAVAIRPPTVPPGTARLRLAFSALHTEADVNRLVAALHVEGIGTHG